MFYAYCVLAALLVFFSWKSLTGGVSYLRFFRRESERPDSGFRPFATVFAPCRGVDEGLADNLTALLEQDYGEFEVVFAVDSENDPSVGVIRRLIEGARVPVRLVVAGPAAGESQKVHNLRAAVTEADLRSEVFVFVDSDARPGPLWLASLVAPLADAGVGSATGYRWFIAGGTNPAGQLRSAWNASIASALGENTSGNFCWGGSMAIRRDVFERVGIRGKWRGTLSDDFAVTRAMKASGLPIVFVPGALTASVEDCGWRELLEFTTRQMKITRVYAPHLWKLSFFGSGLFCAVMVSSVLMLAFGAAFWVPLLTVGAVSLLSVGKSVLRLRAVAIVLPEHGTAIRGQYPAHCVLWLFTPALFLYNCLCALVSSEIAWRGIRYRMVSPSETVRLD